MEITDKRADSMYEDMDSETINKIIAYDQAKGLDELFRNQLIDVMRGLKIKRQTFLALSEALTNIRDKADLTALFNAERERLSRTIHIAIHLIDSDEKIFIPFCYTSEEELEDAEAVEEKLEMEDGFLAAIKTAPEPFLFELNEYLNDHKLPEFIQQYYLHGMRIGLVVPLRSKMEIIGMMQIYADSTERFEGGFREILLGIAPQVSNVISNILLNAEATDKEMVNKNLIALSNDLVSVRHKKDLLNVLNKGIKNMFGISHSAIAVVDTEHRTYSAFLTDQDVAGKDLSKFSAALRESNMADDGIINNAMGYHGLWTGNASTIDLRDSPLWYRFNYALGIRETAVKILPNDAGSCYAIMFFAEGSKTFNNCFRSIIERISDQLASVVKKIDTNDKLIKREREKTFLLDFSNDVARVKSKEDLFLAVKKSLKKLSPVKMYAIAKINEDGKTISSYFHDADAPAEFKAELYELEKAKFPIDDGIQERVLANTIPIVLSIEQEIQRGNTPVYIRFWKKMGFEQVVGTALRTANTELGILWVGMAEINSPLLRGICAQISIAMSNIAANEQLLHYKKSLEIENNDLHEQIKTFYNFTEIIGSGSEMTKIYNLINIVGPSDTTVMISGETGTGKELIARAIHNSSSRKPKMLVKVNCAALPANLIESELFGHEKGSFTGAYERRIGKFELAHEGTIFLDEIGEMPLDLQVKLLRVLQEREFERIGGKSTISVNVRIIAATNRDLLAEVHAGRFRSDLFYRLNVFPMQLPPLRARQEDIEPLANFFLERYSKLTGLNVASISPLVIQQLRNYSWPGNIRELEHLMERSILLSQDNILREVDLPTTPPDITGNQWAVVHNALDDAERAYILEVLKACNGRISGNDGAADILDIPASTLHSRMKKLGILKIHYAGG